MNLPTYYHLLNELTGEELTQFIELMDLLAKEDYETLSMVCRFIGHNEMLKYIEIMRAYIDNCPQLFS